MLSLYVLLWLPYFLSESQSVRFAWLAIWAMGAVVIGTGHVRALRREGKPWWHMFRRGDRDA